MKIPNYMGVGFCILLSLARIVSEDSQLTLKRDSHRDKSSKDS